MDAGLKLCLMKIPQHWAHWAAIKGEGQGTSYFTNPTQAIF